MNEKTPHTKNTVSNSSLQAGEDLHIGDNNITYNNYFQDQTVEIPRYLTLNIPDDAEHILGREDELKAIDDHLAQDCPTVLVNGIGGIGKTFVATKYMATRGGGYQHLAWLTVESNLKETFINNTVLLDALQLHEIVKELVAGQQTAAAFEVVLAHLNRLEKTLIVVDNANDLSDLMDHKTLFDTSRCSILITSRNQPQDWTVVGINELRKEEAVALFRRTAPSVEQEGVTDDAICDLLERLFYHTLLIELIARALTHAGFSFVEIQQMVAEKFIHDPELNEDTISTGSHGNSTSENAKRSKIEEYIWLIFNEIKELSDSVKKILRAIALLPLAKAFDRDFLKKHLENFAIEDSFPDLTLLTERGWIEQEQSPGQKPIYKMHPLIGDVVVKHLEVSADFAREYIVQVADLINYDPQNPRHNLFEINSNRPFAERLQDLFYSENTSPVGKLLNSLGFLYKNFGLFQKSAEIQERALSIAETIYEKGHAEIATCQNNLANVYSDLGRYEKAAALLESSLESTIKNYGEDNPKVAARQSNLANVYKNLSRYEKAAELLEAALQNAVKNYGNEHPTVSSRQSNLANVYSYLGRYEKAAELLETALQSAVKNFGKDHPSVAVSQSNLALVYKDFGQYEKAVELLETALQSDLKNFGKDHPSVALRQNNLALVYYKTGRKEEAKVLWQTAYKNYLKNLGPDHPHTILFKKHAEL